MSPGTPILESVSSRLRSSRLVRIWLVRKLNRLAERLPVEDVPLRKLADLDEVGWFGGPGCAGRLTVREVAEHAKRIAEADLSRPILLSAEGQVLDGLHRVARAYLEGRTAIRAKRLPVTPPPDQVEFLPDWYVLEGRGGPAKFQRGLAGEAAKGSVKVRE